MEIEAALRWASEKLTAAQSTPETISAAWAAADTGELTAIALARMSISDAPGYLNAANAFAGVRRSLDAWNANRPMFSNGCAVGEFGETHAMLAKLAELLVERLSTVAKLVDVPDLNDAIADASRMLGEASQALSGPVPDDADVR